MASTPVQKELRKIAADYRRYRILRELAVGWALIASLGALVLLAYWAFSIYAPHSVPLLFGFAIIAGAIVFWRHSRTDVALREIARLIEKDDPRLNTLLLAAAEQQPDPNTGHLNFLQIRVIQEAIEANKRTPWNERFAQRLFFAQSVHLVFLCVLTAVILACAFTVPHATRHLATRSGMGVEISPGNVSVEKGSTVAVLARFSGAPPSEVRLVYQSVGGEEKKLSMARSLSDPLFGVTLPELHEKTIYSIEYGSTQSEQFTADVFEYPDLKRADAELKFPEYTGFKPAKVEDTRRISAVEGTAVHYTFFLNKPVKSARLIGTNETQLALTNSSQNAISYTTDFALLESGNFKLELVDEQGRTNKFLPEFVFLALENQRPKLKLKTPRGDQRVSALEEVAFNAQVEDDFGLAGYGLAYRMEGQEIKNLSLSPGTNVPATFTAPHEAREFGWTLALEKLRAKPEQLVSYYLWAEDLGPNGKPRRTESDMFFAEIRPFEEIFRAGESNSGQQEGSPQQNQNPATELLQLQKQIITATWNLQRRETAAKPTPVFKKDAEVVRDSQQKAWQQAEELKERLRDEKSHAIIGNVITAMDSAVKNLREAADDNSVQPLPGALEFEQSAYQALLKLQAREYQVSRSRSQNGQQRNGGEQRAQRQLDQLEFKEEENRYESQSQASPLQNAEQREMLQVLNRLKELARRQEGMSERLKELQTALNEAKTQEEKEKIERILKRLQEEQQQIVQDTDELRQRMAQSENQSRMADARQQLDKSREQSREAAEQLEQQNISQALSSSSRAQKELQQLSDQFRKSTSSQFAEKMRNLRQQARELTEKQEQLQQKLEERAETRQRTLSDEGPKKEIAEGLAQQRSVLTNVMQTMRQVTEQSETAEPLLSRQLYETWRKASQSDPEKNLQIASQALDRNVLPLAREANKRNEEPIRTLAQGVEQAARNVLGDEAESLRFAEKELQELAERVEREMNRALGLVSTNRSGSNSVGRASTRRGTNGVPSFAQAGSTNRVSGAHGPGDGEGQGGEEGANEELASNENGGEQTESGQRRSSGNRQGQRASAQGQRSNGQQSGASQQGEPESGQSQDGEQPGQVGEQQLASANNQEGQQGQQGEGGQGQRGQRGQRGEQGQRGQGGREGEGGQPGENGQPGAQGQQAQQGRGEGGQPGGQPQPGRGEGGQPQQRFFEQWAGAGGDGGGANNGGTWNEGPLTGRDFTAWSDRLRDLEEVLQNPQLRTDVARVRDRARAMRMEFKRHATLPRWDVVGDDVVKPLRILQRRVAEELARFGGRDSVVPVDRDPVPQKYTDLVSRYYERLGKD